MAGTRRHCDNPRACRVDERILQGRREKPAGSFYFIGFCLYAAQAGVGLVIFLPQFPKQILGL